MNDIVWSYRSFDDLNNEELYGILRLRADVFVVEQNCVYQDLDNKDQEAIHLTGIINKKLVAYTRLFLSKPNSNNISKIGRVVVDQQFRKSSIGKTLMNKSIDYLLKHSPTSPIVISAQCYLDHFYTSLGFKKRGENYLEDGIPHQEMILNYNEE